MPRDENSRAAFAGLAATGSLLAATAAAALVVGGLLGFGAFPGAADQARTAPLRVAPAPARATARAPILVARAAHRPPRRSLRHRARERTVRAPRRHGGLPTAPPAPAHGAATATATGPAPAHPGRPPSGGAPNPPPPDGGPLAPAVHAARGAGAAATAAGAPVAPAATGPVETAGAGVAGAVEQADHAAAATLETLGR